MLVRGRSDQIRQQFRLSDIDVNNTWNLKMVSEGGQGIRGGEEPFLIDVRISKSVLQDALGEGI